MKPVVLLSATICGLILIVPQKLKSQDPEVNWRDMSKGYQNQAEIYAGIMSNLISQLTTTLGLFATDRRSSSGYAFSTAGYHATIISFGLALQTDFLEFDFLLADSRVLSDTSRKQTLLRVGVGASL